MGFAPAQVREMSFWEFGQLCEQWVLDNTAPDSEAPTHDEFMEILRAEAEERI